MSTKDTPPASTQVFAIPELLESIVSRLKCSPAASKRDELLAIQTVFSCQRVSKLWLAVIRDSICIRDFCYLPRSSESESSTSTSTPTSAAPATWTQTPTLTPTFSYNPFISTMILSHQQDRRNDNTHKRGREDPWLFNGDCCASQYGPPMTASSGSDPRQTWTFCLHVSRETFARFASSSSTTFRGNGCEQSWRSMYATDPPFYSAWLTRSGQMLASEWRLSEGVGFREDGYNDDGDGHGSVWDVEDEYVAATKFTSRHYRLSKRAQRCRVSRPEGFRLGDLVDIIGEAFGTEGDEADTGKGSYLLAKWVAIESCREDEVEAPRLVEHW